MTAPATARRHPLPAAEAIPAELRELPQWVAWKWAGQDKLPVDPHTGALAKTNDPLTWASFQEAYEYARKHRLGVGFVFSEGDPFVGIDLDDIRDPETGAIAVQHFERIEAFASYAEISPSGRGAKVVLKARLGRAWKKPGIEIYPHGRFFTITGEHLPGMPTAIEEGQAALDALIAAEFPGGNGYRAEPIPEIITERARNNTLASLAGSMRRRGLQQEVIETALLEVNEAQCNPPLAEAEVKGIARSVAHYPAGAIANSPNGLTATSYPLSEAGDAELFAHLHGGRVRFDHARSRYLLWAGHWWAEDTDGELTRLALETTRTRKRLAAEIEDADLSKKVFGWAVHGEAKHRLVHMLDLAGCLPPIADSGTGWDAAPLLLGVANGVVDLRTARLTAGQRADRITMHTGIAFDPEAQCPRWEGFLHEVFKDNELADYLKRAIGYTLTADISEQCLFMCYGTGSNGKTVFLATLRRILGAFAYDAPFATFELNTRPVIPNDVAALVNQRLVTSSETNEATRLNEARVKALTGGDPVTARFLHGEFFTFQPVAKFWLAVNHKPRVADDSHGFWRRVRLIPFTQRFEGDRVDSHLDAKLAAEAPGILAWAVRGALEWQRCGLKPPKVVKAATEAYQAESDPLAPFLAEACVIGSECITKGAGLYKAYLAWAEAEGIRERERLSHIAFGQRMGERFHKVHARTGASYAGVGLALDRRQV